MHAYLRFGMMIGAREPLLWGMIIGARVPLDGDGHQFVRTLDLGMIISACVPWMGTIISSCVP